MTFVTEASIDLADDAELMALMVDANIRVVFVGIETPNEAALRETRKLQNLRKGATMLEKVHAIQRSGIEVWSGMILGFDSDDAAIFDAQRAFITHARIVNVMVGMLAAIPKTPLYARLAREGRLDPSDPPGLWDQCHSPPFQLARALRDSYLNVMARSSFSRQAYFDRLDALYLDERIEPERSRRRRHCAGIPCAWRNST